MHDEHDVALNVLSHHVPRAAGETETTALADGVTMDSTMFTQLAAFKVQYRSGLWQVCP